MEYDSPLYLYVHIHTWTLYMCACSCTDVQSYTFNIKLYFIDIVLHCGILEQCIQNDLVNFCKAALYIKWECLQAVNLHVHVHMHAC